MASVSSSSTLWATASKDWVIQPKPKPGRKPKKEVVIPEPVEDVDGKGRRVQNRAAQRAFRERKQSQLAELQARIHSYEQGEIERNVALQSIAKRLKEENEVLRQENTVLQEKLAAAEKELGGKRHWRDDSPTSSIGSVGPTRKRQRIDDEQSGIFSNITATFSSASPPSMVSSPGSNDTSDAPFSPALLDHHLTPGHPSTLDLSAVEKFHYVDHSVFMSCGFCSDHLPCVCRDPFGAPTDMVPKTEGFDTSAPAIIRIGSPVPNSPPSILDQLPAFQPAVPLRRRQTAATTHSVAPTTAPTCSGDPSNCLACADDTFGKAFCDALGKSVAAQASSASTPADNFAINPAEVSFGPSESYHSQGSEEESMSTSDAWKQLKSHPNVAFSDLALLADVVARRSKCTGPRVVISPAPGSITPERVASPDPPLDIAPDQPNDLGSVVLTDPHAHFRQQERARSSPPRLVPQEILLQRGQERLRQVQAAGVREALRLLDAKYTTP